jgi:hypothetical protein
MDEGYGKYFSVYPTGNGYFVQISICLIGLSGDFDAFNYTYIRTVGQTAYVDTSGTNSGRAIVLLSIALSGYQHDGQCRIAQTQVPGTRTKDESAASNSVKSVQHSTVGNRNSAVFLPKPGWQSLKSRTP